jgi:hypothetical protein
VAEKLAAEEKAAAEAEALAKATPLELFEQKARRQAQVFNTHKGFTRSY